MGKVEVKSSAVLFGASNALGEIRDAMQGNLKNLLFAFENACEQWKDNNSQTCNTVLKEHTAVMSSALGLLQHLESATHRLSQLAEEYENIY